MGSGRSEPGGGGANRPMVDSSQAQPASDHSEQPAVGRMGAPQVTIETITVTRPLKVIAFTCCFITVILMTAATSTADWILAEGWREGLFMQCIEEGAPTPLPFNMDPTVGCSKARTAGYVGLVAAFVIIGLICDFFGTFLTGLGLRRTDPNKKYKYYRVAIYALVVALIMLTLAAIIYPVSFSKDLAKAPAKDGGVVEPLLRVGDLDFDNDGIIDHLDEDDDNDGINDDEDPDDDNDGIDGVDDPDDDNDGIPDELDGNPEDFDGDGIEDDDDEDDDNDGIPDDEDPDDDNDGIHDAVDSDDDNDGISDSQESDVDDDGIPDEIDDDDGLEDDDQDNDGIPDEDDDNDGTADDEDNDDDNDGVPDDEDDDDDNDGISDDVDDDNESGESDEDADDDGIPDSEDGDDDGDGVPDAEDNDDDNDGIPDDEDFEGGPRT